ncbi:PCRF domain-containing protein, partial [bacterium]|nr:PCRF domain-containing protein [bacterium]
MHDKAENLIKSFRELEKRLSEPNVMSDQNNYLELARKHKSTKPTVKLAERYISVYNELKDYKEIISSKEDPELVEIAQEELPKLEEQEESLAAELKIALLPKDKDATRNIIAE